MDSKQIPTQIATTTTPTAKSEKSSQDRWVHFVGGGVGGLIGALVTSPLDVVRTRLQSASAPKNHNVSHSLGKRIIHPIINTGHVLSDIYKLQGIRGLFSGIGPNLTGIIPSRAIQFAAYGNGKRIYTELNGGLETPGVHLMSAATAGAITAVATNPIWMIKTRMQLQHMDRSKPPPYRNSIQCIATIFRKEGLLGFYKGTSASFLGISEGTIQWMLYERFKKIIRDKKAKLENIPGGDHSIKKSINDWFEYFGAAASAKLISAVIAYPHEVLRTRLRQLPDSNGQVKYTGLTQAAKVIWKEEGLFAFYGGLAPHLMRTVPNAAIMFLSYELVLHYFGSS